MKRRVYDGSSELSIKNKTFLEVNPSIFDKKFALKIRHDEVPSQLQYTVGNEHKKNKQKRGIMNTRWLITKPELN